MAKILFISHRIPYPPNKGDKIRSFNELSHLSKSNEIHLVAFYENQKEVEYKNQLLEYCEEVHLYHLRKFRALVNTLIFLILGRSMSEGYYFSLKMSRQINRMLAKNTYDLIFCFSSQIGQYVIHEPIPKIMDFCDVDSEKWRQFSGSKRFPLNILYQIEGRRLAASEKKIHNLFSTSLLATEQESELFAEIHDTNESIVVRNGVDLDYYYPQNANKEQALIFVGAMDYYPNSDAVLWFAENVFSKFPAEKQIKFYVVGGNAPQEIIDLQKTNPNIIVTGFVDDIRSYISRAKIAVIPLRIARGIQNKVLEAMAMGIPVAIPEMIFKSMENLDKNHAFVYQDHDELGQLILDNIDNDDLLEEKGKKLREYVLDNYKWKNNLRTLDTIISKTHRSTPGK